MGNASQSGDERRKSSKGSRKKTKEERNERGEKIYCSCREPEGGRFMIACDCCDEWYHGACVGITKAEGKGIECYYCDKCTSATPNLQIIYKDTKEPDTKGSDPNAPPQRCGACIACCTQPDCGKCSRCKSKNGRCVKVICMPKSEKTQDQLKILPELPPENQSKDEEPKDEPKTEQKTEPKVELKVEVKREPKVEVKIEPKVEAKKIEPKSVVKLVPKSEPMDEEKDENYSPPSTSRKAGGGGVAVAGSAKQPPKGGRKKVFRNEKDGNGKVAPKRGGRDKQQKAVSDGALVERVVVGSAAYKAHLEKERKDFLAKRGPVQCHGIDCVTEARRDSKYCSDQCGMRRAKERIGMYLPKGAENYWRVEPVAVRQTREEELAKEQTKEELNKEKADLDRWYNLMIDYVQALKPFIPDEKEDGNAVGDFIVACPVCTVEFGCKVVGRHIEKCYARSEKQSTYGTNSKCAVNPNGIFCDQYNKSNDSYCKRLRVACPEHYKGDIEEGVEVCGYPTAWYKSESTTLEKLFTSVEVIIREGFCGMARKDCKKHNGWIALILGLIDNRRLAYFHKMEDLVDKKSVKKADATLLMTNHTEYHQPLEKILEMYEEGAKNGGETVLAALL